MSPEHDDRKERDETRPWVWLGPGWARWLRSEVAGADVPPAEWKDIFAEAVSRRNRRRSWLTRVAIGAVRTLALIAAMLIAFVATIAMTRSLPLGLAAIFLAALVTIPLLHIVRPRAFERDLRVILRERGYEVCMSCGYSLKGLHENAKHCPECGGPREPISPDSTTEGEP